MMQPETSDSALLKHWLAVDRFRWASIVAGVGARWRVTVGNEAREFWGEADELGRATRKALESAREAEL